MPWKPPHGVKGMAALGSSPCLVKMGPAAGSAAGWRGNDYSSSFMDPVGGSYCTENLKRQFS